MIHEVSKLPKWAQKIIHDLEYERDTLTERMQHLETAHQILCHRDWTNIPGPGLLDGETCRNLWILNRNSPTKVCELYKGDVLLIGRQTPMKPDDA